MAQIVSTGLKTFYLGITMSEICPLLQLDNLQKSFINPEGKNLLVLENISLTLNEGEIVVLLGKSGSGKSTLLRLISGLSKPSSGSLLFRGVPILKPIQGISMVFQNAALLPWLTVFENVELGLEAQGVPRDIRRTKVLKAIDTIGMDGFESAYPKELSGGMKQRVGFARALVVEPELLLMDESFSALDILTAENLRNDLIDLWFAKRTRIKSVICVTHDIEEAVLMANRILIFASDPGHIQKELCIDLPFPRETASSEFRGWVDKIYSLMTTSERERVSKAKLKAKSSFDIKHPEYAYRLPNVSVSELTGLLEAIESNKIQDKINLPELSSKLHLDVDDLFPLTEVLDMMQFASISKGELLILEAGNQFAAANILERKQIFAKHLLAFIPLAKHIREVLDLKPNHRISKDFFSDELGSFLTFNETERLLKVIIDWGRYAEIFAYDYDTEIFSLENP